MPEENEPVQGETLEMEINFSNIFTRFLDDASVHVSYLVRVKDDEILRSVQGLLTDLDIAANAIDGMEAMTRYRERLGEYAKRVANERRIRDAKEDWRGARVRMGPNHRYAGVEGDVQEVGARMSDDNERVETFVTVLLDTGVWNAAIPVDDVEYVE